MLKEEKVCNPASRRVRDAAEDLLSCILEQVDYFPSACGAESLSSLLDEVSLLQHCNSLNGEILPMSEAVQNFRYFVVDNSTIMAILEEPLGNEQVYLISYEVLALRLVLNQREGAINIDLVHPSSEIRNLALNFEGTFYCIRKFVDLRKL